MSSLLFENLVTTGLSIDRLDWERSAFKYEFYVVSGGPTSMSRMFSGVRVYVIVWLL